MKKIFLTAFLVMASPAFAGDIYIAGSLGRSNVDLNQSDLDNAVTSAGATGLSSSLDKHDTGYKAQVGYQFTPNFALEGGYVDLGEGSYSGNYTGGNVNATIKASGFNIAALGILPINESFSVFGKLGTIRAKVEAQSNATGPAGAATGSVRSTDWESNFGIGGTYNISKQLGIRAEYERFNKLGDSASTGEGDVDLLSAGVMYKF